MELSRGGNLGGLSLDLSRLPFPEEPLDPEPAMLYGSSSGTGIRGRFLISMAGRGFLTKIKNEKGVHGGIKYFLKVHFFNFLKDLTC